MKLLPGVVQAAKIFQLRREVRLLIPCRDDDRDGGDNGSLENRPSSQTNIQPKPRGITDIGISHDSHTKPEEQPHAVPRFGSIPRSSRANGARAMPKSAEGNKNRRTFAAQKPCNAISLTIVPVVTSSSCGLLSCADARCPGSAENSTSPNDIACRGERTECFWYQSGSQKGDNDCRLTIKVEVTL